MPNLKLLLKTVLLLSSVFLTGYTSHLRAQMPPGYNTMMKNNSFRQSHNQFTRSLRHIHGTQYLANSEGELIVLMADSTQVKVHSKVYSDTVLKKNYLVYINKKLPKSDSNRKKLIYPEQTLQVNRIDLVPKVVGTPTDSCWVFRVITGKINAYSFLTDTYGITSEHLIAIQVNNGPIEPISEERLKQIMINDEKALRALEKKDIYKAITKFNAVKF